MKNLLVEHAYSNLKQILWAQFMLHKWKIHPTILVKYLDGIIRYPLSTNTEQQYHQCETNIIDAWTQIQSISRYIDHGVRGTIDLSII